MDCIFRARGVIPQSFICYDYCVPLEKIFLSAGCDFKEAVACSKKARRAFSIINLEDEFRDESSYRKYVAKIWSIPYLLSVPSDFRKKLQKINAEVARLEASGSDLDTYLSCLSQLCCSLFEVDSRKKQEALNSISLILIESVLLQDMIEDLNSDIQTCKYNPLKSFDSAQIASISKELEIKFYKLTQPLAEIKNVKLTPPKKRNFWEDLLNIHLPRLKSLFS